jgi:peptide-methionine (R)-S-oxide reductase
MTVPQPRVQLSDDEWRQQLNPKEFDLLLRAGTESPFHWAAPDTTTDGV